MMSSHCRGNCEYCELKQLHGKFPFQLQSEVPAQHAERVLAKMGWPAERRWIDDGVYGVAMKKAKGPDACA